MKVFNLKQTLKFEHLTGWRRYVAVGAVGAGIGVMLISRTKRAGFATSEPLITAVVDANWYVNATVIATFGFLCGTLLVAVNEIRHRRCEWHRKPTGWGIALIWLASLLGLALYVFDQPYSGQTSATEQRSDPNPEAAGKRHSPETTMLPEAEP